MKLSALGGGRQRQGQNKRVGGQAGWGVSGTAEAGGGNSAGNLTMRRKTGGRERNRDSRAGAWFSSLSSNILQQGPQLRPCPLGDTGREGASLWILGSKGPAWPQVTSRSLSHIRREKS